MAQRSQQAKKRKKTKYRKVAFKLSDKESSFINKCSNKLGTTSNRLIKKAIREYLQKHSELLVEEPNYVTKNQLKLFDFTEDEEIQLTMFDEEFPEEEEKEEVTREN